VFIGPLQSRDQYRHRLTAPERNPGAIEPYGNGISAQWTFVQDLNCRAFQKPDFEEPALKLRRRQSLHARSHSYLSYPATKSGPRQAQRGTVLAHAVLSVPKAPQRLQVEQTWLSVKQTTAA
jgi:hypothetical protein